MSSERLTPLTEDQDSEAWELVSRAGRTLMPSMPRPTTWLGTSCVLRLVPESILIGVAASSPAYPLECFIEAIDGKGHTNGYATGRIDILQELVSFGTESSLGERRIITQTLLSRTSYYYVARTEEGIVVLPYERRDEGNKPQ